MCSTEHFQVKAVSWKGATESSGLCLRSRESSGYWWAGSASEKPLLPTVSHQSPWPSSCERRVQDITGTNINFIVTLTQINCPSIIYHYIFQRWSFFPMLSLRAKIHQSPWRANINWKQSHLPIVYNNLRRDRQRERNNVFQENCIAQHLDH